MPRGDGTGPRGQGPGTGRRSGRGRGGRQNGFAMGPGGDCMCPSCGHALAHQSGVPCTQVKCPKCGQYMTRRT